jgi:N-acetylglucosaminyl-diphospho-decaprenol L-rhamnosyltransferase
MSATVLTIILNYKTGPMTLQAAEAARVAMTGVPGAITIVDNDSQDGSYEYLCQHTADWPDVRVIQSGHNGGFGAGNNVGIRAGLPDGRRPDFVYIQNSDAFPDPQTIRGLLDHMVANPTCGFAGSHVYGEDGATHPTAFRFPSILSEIEGGAHTGFVTRLLRNHRVVLDLPTEVTPVDWCAGASVMLRMDTLDQIGLFDETFFLYFEETDLCRRVWHAGWTGMYLPHIRTMHIGSVSTGMSRWKRVPRYWFDSRAHYFRKNHGTAYLAAVTLAYLTAASFWQLRRRLERKEDRIPPYFLRDLVDHTRQVLMPNATANRTETRAQKQP